MGKLSYNFINSVCKLAVVTAGAVTCSVTKLAAVTVSAGTCSVTRLSAVTAGAGMCSVPGLAAVTVSAGQGGIFTGILASWMTRNPQTSQEIFVRTTSLCHCDEA